MSKRELESAELWARLRAATPARIGLGRSGDAITTEASLDFQMAHARARDAIYRRVDFAGLAERIGRPAIQVHSCAADRAMFVRRPDLGRTLDADSHARLAQARATPPWDIVIAVADGLSADAIEDHAAAFLHVALAKMTQWRIAPIILAEQARVALSDEIGAALDARLAVMLIGERPGLSVSNSMGIYLTYGPRRGRSDGERNCLSNIHASGLSYEAAAEKLMWLAGEALRLQATGFFLKENAAPLLPPAGSAQSIAADSEDAV